MRALLLQCVRNILLLWIFDANLLLWGLDPLGNRLSARRSRDGKVLLHLTVITFPNVYFSVKNEII